MNRLLVLLDHEADWSLRGETKIFLRGLLPDEVKKAEEIWTKGMRIKPRETPNWPWIRCTDKRFDLLESWCKTEDLHKLRPYLFPGWEVWPRYMYKAGKDWTPCHLPESLWKSPFDMPEDAIRAYVSIVDMTVCRLVDLRPYEVYGLLPKKQTLLDPDEETPIPGMRQTRRKQSEVLEDYIELMRDAALPEMEERCFWEDVGPYTWVYVIWYRVRTYEDEEESEWLQNALKGART